MDPSDRNGTRDPSERDRIDPDRTRDPSEKDPSDHDRTRDPSERDRTDPERTREPPIKDPSDRDKAREPSEVDRIQEQATTEDVGTSNKTTDPWRRAFKNSRFRNPSCNSGKTDLVFIIDSSTNIGPSEHEVLREWLQEVAQAFDVVGKDEYMDGELPKTNIAIVQYATDAKIDIPLGEYATREELLLSMEMLQRMGGDTHTGKAIDFAQTAIFETTGRPDATRVAVLITDGKSDDDVRAPSTIMKESGTQLLVVGIGEFSEDEILEMASEPSRKFTFTAEDYMALEDIRKKVQWAICRETRRKGDKSRKKKQKNNGQCTCKPGQDGKHGLPGKPGLRGAKGARGERGAEGKTGRPGLRGVVGPRGPPGPPGLATSSSSARNDTEKKMIEFDMKDENNPLTRALRALEGEGWDQTKTGRNGIPGPRGPAGKIGLPGISGSDGPRGPQGPPGRDGLRGPPGAEGVPGPQGPVGPRGIDGWPGTKGDKGDSASEEYIISITKKVCESMIKEHEERSHRGGSQNVLADRRSSSRVVIQRGPPGPPGERGYQGRPGSQGYEGPPGLQGYPGQPGPKGASGMKGNLGDKGERGSPGIGVAGAPGIPGPPGPPGEADRGHPGIQGRVGMKGQRGPRGYKGQKGEMGFCSAYQCNNLARRQRRSADLTINNEETRYRSRRSTRNPNSRSNGWWPWN